VTPRRLRRLRLAAVLVIALAALLLAAAFLPGAQQRSTGAGKVVVLVSSAPDRAQPRALRGRTLFGRAYVFLRGAGGAIRARYFLDDPRMTRRPLAVTGKAPFALRGRRGFDTTNLAHGGHTLTVELRFANRTRVLTVPFRIRHLFASPRGGSTACSRTRPCGSWDRAYHLARPGQVVELAGGTYPGQTLTFDPRKTSSQDVVFRPRKGARVTVAGEVELEGVSHVTFKRMTVGDFFIGPESTSPDPGAIPRDVSVLDVRQRFFFVRAAVNVRIAGGAVGGVDNAIVSTIGTYPGQPPARNVLVERVRFHDVTRRADPEAHVECLFIQESNGVTVRRSRFTRCDVMGVFVNQILGGTISNLRIENNFFDRPTDGGYYALAVYPVNRGRILYNSFAGTALLRTGNWSNFAVIGNAGRLSACVSGVRFAHNVWSNARCSSTDRRAQPGFRNAARFDLHLKPGAAAVNRGDRGTYPPVDIDGHRRPRGGAPDAGADEAR
jgi:hypothetical protein